MRSIHNINDLRKEQQHIEQRRLELEKELQRDWSDIKDQLGAESSALIKGAGSRFAAKWAIQGIFFGAGMLARKFGGKIGSKIYSWFK